jgi:hypothetical protein
VIEVGDVIRIGEEDYRVVRMVRDGRFVVRRIRAAAAQDQGEIARGEEGAA